jgi:hypothetical protein
VLQLRGLRGEQAPFRQGRNLQSHRVLQVNGTYGEDGALSGGAGISDRKERSG